MVFVLAALAVVFVLFYANQQPPPDPSPPSDGTPPDGITPSPAGTPPGAGPVQLPGPNHSYDNQFVYAASLYAPEDGRFGAVFPDQWTGGLFLKVLTWREHAKSWGPWPTASINNNPPVEISVGLMQINVLAHTEFTQAQMLDPNQNILAGASIAADAWQRGSADVGLAATVYNEGPGGADVVAGVPNQYGQDVAAEFAALAPGLPSSGV